jgi:hypothetical protein
MLKDADTHAYAHGVCCGLLVNTMQNMNTHHIEGLRQPDADMHTMSVVSYVRITR